MSINRKHTVIIVTTLALIGIVSVARKISQQNLTFGSIELPTTHPVHGTKIATKIQQFEDVQPTEWYYQPLRSVVRRYQIIYPYKDDTFRPNKSITKAELIFLTSNALIKLHEIFKSSLLDAKHCRYEGVPETSFNIPKNINSNDWYYLSYRNLATLVGDEFDYSNSQFEGDESVNRYEMAVILNRSFNGFSQLIESQTYQKSQIYPSNFHNYTSLGSYHITKASYDNKNYLLKNNSTILSQVSVSQFSDVHSNHWAFQDIQNIINKYGATAGYPDGTFRGNNIISRGEFVAQLSAGLDSLMLIMLTRTEGCADK